MNKLLLHFCGAILGSCAAYAGHHWETVNAKSNPQYDIQDVYAFQSAEKGKTAFAMTFNPNGSPGNLNTFGNDGLYQFHLGEDSSMEKGKTLTFQFKGDTLEVFISSEGFPKLGEKGDLLGSTKIGEPKLLKDGIRVWADTIKDPFRGNGKALFPFKDKVNQGIFEEDAFSSNPGDLFNTSVCGGIVFEIPNESLPKSLFYCASSSKDYGNNHWHRINRIGHVLLPHLYMEGNEVVTSQNLGTIAEDKTRRPLAVATIKKYSTLAGAQKDPQQYAEKMAELILPDAVPYTPGTEASYTLPKINGRKLSDNAMDTAMEILVGKPFPAHSGTPNNLQEKFPYLLKAEKN